MEEPTNQDQSELFKNIAIATVVSINDVKGMQVVEGIASPQSSLQEPVVATAVASVSSNAATSGTPSNIPEPLHNIEEAIAIAVVKSSQDGDGHRSEGASEQTLTRTPTGTRRVNPQNPAIRNKSIEEKTIEINQLLGNNESDDESRQIASELVNFLNNEGIAITDNNGVTYKINVPNTSQQNNPIMDKAKEILKNIFADM